jgi:hypothetical protein
MDRSRFIVSIGYQNTADVGFSSVFWLKLPLEPMGNQGFEVTPSIYMINNRPSRPNRKDIENLSNPVFTANTFLNPYIQTI